MLSALKGFMAKRLGCSRIHVSVPFLEAMGEDKREQLRKDFEEISVSCHSMEDMELAVKVELLRSFLERFSKQSARKA